ncbi:G2/M phase-specific E3 ubiquitin-protein ligase-like [Trichomycterus rosablanca]|uniref:G2/M phase-specific E3 ubiquitin-protein ligase-like n=1 Tax=Trichomycterus rosablanca TaxID=2290929 RepID=UPI002F350AA1
MITDQPLLSTQTPQTLHSAPSLPSLPSVQSPQTLSSVQSPQTLPSTPALLSLPSNQGLQSMHSDQAQPSLLFAQAPLALTSAQALSTMPSAQVPSTWLSSQAPANQPSTQVPPTLPSSQLSLVTASGLLAPPSDQALLPPHSNQAPQVITIEDQTPAYPSIEPPVIILEDQEGQLSVSPPQSPLHPLDLCLDETDLQTILKKLASKVDMSACPTSNQINVCRDRILESSLHAFKRRRFNPAAKLDVVFVDEDEKSEGAVDEGGPTREYLRLLMRAILQSNIFEGHEEDRRLALDTKALESKLYTWIGKMISVCLVHGGIGPHFFSERLYQQICGIPLHPTLVEEVCNHSFREQLIKIQDAKTVREANEAIMEAADSLSIVGALRHVSNLEEKDSLVQSAADFFVNGRVRTALEQFAEGLRTLGLLEELQKNSGLFYDLFVSEERPLLARDMCTLFEVRFSMQGSNRRARENQTICFWRDWLIDIEEGECSPITLEMILEFASGASTVPPLGFPHRPQIEFLHEANKIFPEANTCLIVLRLPVHTDYESFTKYMKEGVLQAPTFGVA